MPRPMPVRTAQDRLGPVWGLSPDGTSPDVAELSEVDLEFGSKV